MKLFLSGYILFLCSCTYGSYKEKQIIKAHERMDTVRQRMIGKWGGPTGLPVWDIRTDSIYYYSTNKAYHYHFNGDTFFVKFPERDTATAFGKVHFAGDTLKIVQYYRDDFVIKCYRSKK